MKLIILLLITYVKTQLLKINNTHYSCDNDKIIHKNNINDDYCDCLDGSDENRTNACLNGKFYCENKLYEAKYISTSKVRLCSYQLNDGVCDCCDGSDEFDKDCSNSCLELSVQDFKTLYDNFILFKKILDGYNTESYKKFYDHTKKKINNIISTYKTFMEVQNKTNLIKSYLNKIEDNLTYEPDDDYEDENEIKLINVRKAYERLNSRLDELKLTIRDNLPIVKSFKRLSIYNDISENCLRTNYRDFECEMCFYKFVCSGYKKKRYVKKHLG